MKKNLFFTRFLLAALLLVFFVGCEKESVNETGNENLLVAERPGSAGRNLESELLKSVRAATARYHSTTLAEAAGYEPDDHCVAVPGLGGMGYHWANPGLVNPVFDPLKPEVMLYASGPDGNLRLVAIEYIVLNVGQPRPMFGDKLLDIGGTPIPAAHWSLHVWLYEPNPNGIFTPFNPNISCP